MSRCPNKCIGDGAFDPYREYCDGGKPVIDTSMYKTTGPYAKKVECQGCAALQAENRRLREIIKNAGLHMVIGGGIGDNPELERQGIDVLKALSSAGKE